MPSLVPFLVVMVLAQALMGACYGLAGVLAPIAAPEMGYSLTALGPYSGVMALAALAGGTLIDGPLRRYGAARTFQISIAMHIVGLLCGASGMPALVALSSALLGFATGMVIPCALHLVARVTPPERAGMVIAINQCGTPAGFGLGGVAFPLLLQVMHWRMSLVVLGAVLALMIPTMQRMRAALDSDRNPAAPLGGRAFAEPLRMAWSIPNLRLLGWLAFSFMTVQMALLSYLVSYVKIELGFSHVAAGSALLASQVAAIASRLFFGWLLDRVGRHFLLLGILGTASGIVAIVLGLADPGWSYASVIIIAAACGTFVMGWNAVYFAAVAKFAPEGRSGTAVGGTQVFTLLGGSVGPLVFAGMLNFTGSYASGFVVTAMFALVMGVRLLWLDMRMTAQAA